MKLIGLVGHIGSGKGTIADILVEKHGFHKESFANSVKDAVSVIFGWDRALLEGDTIHSRKWREEPDEWWSRKMGRTFSPREALQLMGTEAGRDVFHQDIWIHSMERRLNPNKNYVIADVRFPNEIAMIRDLGGKVIRVKRGQNPLWYADAVNANYSGKLKIKRFAEAHPEVHFSEWAWAGEAMDMVLDNNCELDQVPRRVDLMLDSLYNNHIEAVDPREVLQ